MDRDPGDFPRDERIDFAAPPRVAPKPMEAMTDGEFDDWMATLPPPPGWADRSAEQEEADILRADAQAEADIAAGRYYPHSVVSAWLETWGSSDYKPFEEWLKSSG